MKRPDCIPVKWREVILQGCRSIHDWVKSGGPEREERGTAALVRTLQDLEP